MSDAAHNDPPFMVGQANELRRAFDAGDDEAVRRILAINVAGGLHDRLMNALVCMNDAQAVDVAPYISDLARRLGYLQR